MKSSKGKNNVLHLAWNNPMQQYRLWADRLNKSWSERTSQTSWTWTSSRPLKRRRATASWDAASSSREMIPLLSLGTTETTAGVLWTVLWSTSARRPQYKIDAGTSPAQSYCDRMELKDTVYEEWLREVCLSSLEKRRLRADLTATYTYLIRKDGASRSSEGQSGSMKWCKGKFWCDVRTFPL